MDSTKSRSQRQSSKRLVFDRRYGWIIDEWKHPSEEALSGGRGMFCIVPIAKACFETLSKSISHVTINVMERVDDFSRLPQLNLYEQLQNVVLSTKESSLKLLMRNKDNSNCVGHMKMTDYQSVFNCIIKNVLMYSAIQYLRSGSSFSTS